MSHFVLGVFLKKEDLERHEDLEDAVCDALSPFEEMELSEVPKECLKFVASDIASKKEIEEDFKNSGRKDMSEYLEEEWGYVVGDNGEYGYYIDPIAKWDWYEIGGRWSKDLIDKNGNMCNSCSISSIDFDLMARKNEKVLSDIFDECEDSFIRMINGIKENDTKESYVKRESMFSTFAVLKEGEWFERGEMGWFGVSSDMSEEVTPWIDNYYDNFIKNEDPNTTLVIVDCHI